MNKQPNVFTLYLGAAPARGWSDWLGASQLLHRDDGSGMLTAAVKDQAELFGVLLRVRDLGIPLFGVYPGCSLP